MSRPGGPGGPPPPTPLRFYARPTAFVLECPACAEVLIIRGRRAVSTSIVDLKSARIWEPLSSLLTCPQCGRQWVIGLSAYAVELARPALKLPADQQPTLQQAAAIRARLGESFTWGPGRPSIVNQTEPCTCAVTGVAGCLRHHRTPPPLIEQGEPTGGA